jgi:HD-GYP domain-containing protein (c-di-GMP phosphodiesterase class II)
LGHAYAHNDGAFVLGASGLIVTARPNLRETEKLLEWFEALRCQEHTTHDERVGLTSHKLALRLGMDQKTALRLGCAATLHDIGKLELPSNLLNKLGLFTPQETRAIQTHTILGDLILKGYGTPLMNEAAEIALYHHERIDGNGYPYGLSGTDIPFAARIVAVVDSFDAMTEDRLYQAKRTKTQALAELQASASRYDALVLSAFTKMLEP